MSTTASVKGIWCSTGIVSENYKHNQCYQGDVTLLLEWINKIALPKFIDAKKSELEITYFSLENGTFNFNAKIYGNYVCMTAQHITEK